MRGALVLGLLCACGFEHGAHTGDASSIFFEDAPADTQMIDAPPPTSCMAKWLDGSVRLGAINPVDGTVTTSVERDPFLLPDERTIFFFSNRTGNVMGDVYKATRSSATGTFGTAAKFTAADSDGAESKMSMTDDGLYFVVSSNNGGMSGSVDVLDATRATASDNFSLPGRTYTTLDCTGADELDPFVTGDGRDLYLAQTSNGFQHIVHATRLTRSVAFSATTLVTELDSGVGDADPTLSADGRMIIFSSMRANGGGGGPNLWYATRAGTTGPFGTPKRVPDVNGEDSDGDPWLSKDGCRLYFSSTRSGDFDLWSAAVQ